MTTTPNPTETPSTTPELTGTPPTPDDCEECGGEVGPGKYCAACGRNRTNEPVTASFTMPIDLPFIVPTPHCCPNYSATIEAHPDGNHPEVIEYTATYEHRLSCDIWSYI